MKKPLPKLTRKQAMFVKELINDPKLSATKAAARAYNTTTVNGAASIASENLRKPQIISHLADYNELVEATIRNTVQDLGSSEKLGERALATETAKWMHDKVHGKATQKIEQTSTAITLSIDMSGESLHNNSIEEGELA